MYKLIKLNDHQQFLKMLDILEKRTNHIEYVLVDKFDTKLVEAFKSDVIEQKETSKWWGTMTNRKCGFYKIKSSPKLFNYLKKFTSFCIYVNSKWGEIPEQTDFGINDIAFFDDRQEPILFTTTHEGYINLRDDIKF